MSEKKDNKNLVCMLYQLYLSFGVSIKIVKQFTFKNLKVKCFCLRSGFIVLSI